MKTLNLLLLATFLPFASLSAQTTSLTQETLEKVKQQFEALEKEQAAHLSQRNSSAGDIFLRASADPKAAFELWEKCTKLIEFDREEKKDSEFREWKDGNSDKARDDRFLESLMIQLKYVGLSCQAAEAEKIEEVFPSILSYVDGLSRMEELPTNNVLKSVADSNFAKAYNLEALLGKNGRWEPVPFSIRGIYDKTILPHLREKNTAGLMNAWDKRIEQQTRLAQSLNTAMEEAERELRLAEGDRQAGNKKRALNDLVNGDRSNMMQSHDKDDFVREELPRLKWAKLKDQFQYVSPTTGAAAMLQFLKEHLTHELGEEFMNDFKNVISSAESATAQGPDAPSN
ncbi:hypothetical protein VSU19_10975 [Verrucomicrobiales bacterium BCK34]|nr:hypothetical protein [Verrucomicrobiales bacterium BCK34]